MPFIKNEEEQVKFDRAIGIEDLEPEEKPVTFREQLDAAFRLENSLGSFAAREPGLPDSVVDDDNFDVWSELTDQEKLDERFVNNVMLADNIDEVAAVRRQRDREQKDRDTLQNSYLAPFVSAALDPINFIPVGGTAYKTFRTGSSILNNALATATVAAGTTAAQEALLHHTQMTRTFGESAANVTVATLFGGILGAAPKGIEELILRSGNRTTEVFDDVNKTMDPESRIAAGENSAMRNGNLSAAAVDNDPKVRGELAKAVTKFVGFDPLSRSITSDSQATRSIANQLAENPIDMDSPLGTAVETRVKTWDGNYFEAIEGHDEAFKKYKSRDDLTESRIVGFLTGRGILKRRAFNEEVGKAMRNGSDDPQIQAAADSWRSKLYDPLKKEFIDQGLLPEDVDVTTAENYLNRVWNKEKIGADTGGFVKTVKNWLDQESLQKQEVANDTTRLYDSFQNASDTYTIAKSELDELTERLGKAEAGLKEAEGTRQVSLAKRVRNLEESIADTNRRLNQASEEALSTLDELEQVVAKFPGKSANGVRSALNARDGRAVQSATKELRKAVAKIKDFDIDDVSNQDLALEIAGRIMGTPDGRLPYDYKLGENATGGQPNNLSGPFQSRSFNIPDKMVEDWLDNDIEVLAGRYIKQVAPDVELTRQFGDVEMKSQIKDIEQDWIKRAAAETDPKKARALNKQKDRDIESIAAMRDRIRGTFGQTDWDNPWVRAGRTARDLNYMRLLGGVVAASIPDISRIVAAEGLANTFRFGLKPMATNLRGFKMSAREAKLYGVGTDALMGGRAEILADTADFAQGGTAFERAVRSAATKFSSVNLMNFWTGGIKQLHGVVTQSRLIDELRRGVIDKRLNQLGISDADARNIAGELKKHAKKVDGVWIANSRDWDSQDLALMWGGALRKESDRVIIVPGQEKPLFMSSELGKTIFQFKSFMFSATQRVLISNLQAQDKHYMQGILGLIGVGMLSYAFKEWDAGRTVSDDPLVWVTEGIDRSGMLGILMEANNTVEKISSNNYGLRSILGIAEPASRYASRSALDSAVGPTFGLAGELVKIAGAATGEREWSESDTRALRRLLPGQNLSFLRQGLDEIEKVAAP